MAVKIESKTSDLGYQILGDKLQKLLFGDEIEECSRITKAEINMNLDQFGLSLPTDTKKQEHMVPFLPDLKGMKAYDFLNYVAESKYGNIKRRLDAFLAYEDLRLHQNKFDVYDKLQLNPFWTRYPFQDGPISQVDYPVEMDMVCDLETMVTMGSFPIIGAALTDKAYYVWLHPCLVSNVDFYPCLVEVGHNKLVYNHNVMYDAARFHETYDWDKSQRNWHVCSQSQHIAVAGMGNQQRLIHKLWKQGKARYASQWARHTSMNNLVDVYNLHVSPQTRLTVEDKELRDIFVKARSTEIIKENLHILVDYALKDVKYTYELGTHLNSKYFHHNPSLVTFGGMLEIGSSIVPVIEDWSGWLQKVDEVYATASQGINQQLTQLAHDTIEDWKEGKVDETDPWFSCLNWTKAKSGKNKGLPEWYRKKVLNAKTKYPVSTKSMLAPILLRLKWQDNPIVLLPGYKFCYGCDPEEYGAFEYEGKHYARVPHPKGGQNNCGNPLGKDYIKAIDQGLMDSEDPNAQSFMKTAKSVSYWSSYKSRAHSYFAVKSDESRGHKGRLICPQTLSLGTVTRRSVESFFLTLSDPKPGVIGSEAKSRIQLSKDDPRVFVGADMDAQEMRIGAAMADASLGLLGSSAMSLTQMLGSKSTKTDSHSLLAKYCFNDASKDARQTAKVLNFQMLFLSGLKGCLQSIKKNRPDLSDLECKEIAERALTLRRGKKIYPKKAKHYIYRGGTDSECYNYMIRNAHTAENRTPMHRSAISEALKMRRVGSDFMTSRANRSIQSSGSDLLHSFQVMLNYFFELYNLDARFVIAIHDELWSCCRKEDQYLVAWIFQMCSMVVYSAFFQGMGFKSLPYNYLGFSGVNIDRCIRKEACGEVWDGFSDTVTPSNPEPVEAGKILSMEDFSHLRVDLPVAR